LEDWNAADKKGFQHDYKKARGTSFPFVQVNPTAGLPGDNSTRTLVALYPREVISAYLLCLYSKP
jgi:hypothetical protein